MDDSTQAPSRSGQGQPSDEGDPAGRPEQASRQPRPGAMAATLYLLCSGLAGWGWVFLIGMGFLFGGLTALLPPGPMVLNGLFLMTRKGAQIERWWLRALLGQEIDDPYRPLPPWNWGRDWRRGWWPRLRALGGDPATWRDLAYLVLLAPIGTAWTVVTFLAWFCGFLLLFFPVYYQLVPEGLGYINLGNGNAIHIFQATTWGEAVVIAGFGLVMLLVAWSLVRGMASIQSAVARSLLGPSKSAVLARRAEVLRVTRERAVDAAAAERRRIERDLHDGAQQRLVSLAMGLGMAKEKFTDDPEGAQKLVDEAHVEAKRAIGELRNLARGIHPAVLSDRGLDAALSALAGQSPVPVAVTVELPERPAPVLEGTAYFVVSEALTNVTKHAQATRAAVHVHRAGDLLVVEVWDDGHGGAEPAVGTGLIGLTDRVRAQDGTLTLSSPPGGPTLLRVELPCAS